MNSLDKARVREIRKLFDEIEDIEVKILELINGEQLAASVSESVKKRRGRKPKKDYPWTVKKPIGRPRKIKDYICEDCGHPFKSNLALIDTQCPSCSSVNIKVSTVEIIEADN